MGAIDKVTVISTDGASELTTAVAGNVTQGVQLASDLLGIDLASMFHRLANGDRSVLAARAPAVPPRDAPGPAVADDAAPQPS